MKNCELIKKLKEFPDNENVRIWLLKTNCQEKSNEIKCEVTDVNYDMNGIVLS